MSDQQTTDRIERAMEKYAPSGYDPASDDLTIPFAMELVEKDRQIAALRMALGTVKLYIADQMIANAIVVPKGQHPSGNDPSLIQVVNKALGVDEQTARVRCAECDCGDGPCNWIAEQ